MKTYIESWGAMISTIKFLPLFAFYLSPFFSFAFFLGYKEKRKKSLSSAIMFLSSLLVLFHSFGAQQKAINFINIKNFILDYRFLVAAYLFLAVLGLSFFIVYKLNLKK